MIIFIYVYFLYLHKENKPKESAADHLAPLRGTALCCSKKLGAAKLATYSGSDSPRAIQPFSSLLGCVKRPLYVELKQVIHSGNVLLEQHPIQHFE
jgi:hypothetical protein